MTRCLTANLYNDFHFARLTSNYWSHKPSWTAILRFNSAPSNNVVWTNEAYWKEAGKDVYGGGNVTYESDIVYILYRSSHTTTETWTGNHYHSGSRHYYEFDYICNYCGEVVKTEWTSAPCSGNPCVTPWSVQPGTETE